MTKIIGQRYFLMNIKKTLTNFDFEVNSNEKAWNKALGLITQILQALGLFKTTLSLLAIGGLRVIKLDKESPSFSGQFEWENTIINKPYYILRVEE